MIIKILQINESETCLVSILSTKLDRYLMLRILHHYGHDKYTTTSIFQFDIFHILVIVIVNHSVTNKKVIMYLFYLINKIRIINYLPI
jgi:hypothetical protein